MALLKPSRGTLAAKNRAANRRAALALADAPVPVERVDPIVIDAPAVRLCSEPVYAKAPGHSVVGQVPSETARRGNAINDAAALRSYLMGAAEWGPEVRVAVRLTDGRTRIVVGQFGAIARALPDKETVKAWRLAGATEFPLFDLEPSDGGPRRVRWVPIGEVPSVEQIERASRGGN
jgi:hypothetical protein